MKAIVYISKTGYTERYAEILSERTGLPCYSYGDAEEALESFCEIIYLGPIMAGAVLNYGKAKNRWNIKAVCAVGLSVEGLPEDELRKTNSISKRIPIFLLPGGYAPEKLHGFTKFIMKQITKSMAKKIARKADKTESDELMYKVLVDGGSLVNAKHLDGIVDFFNCL